MTPLDGQVIGAIREVVAGDARSLIELRRDIHAHPETAWNEARTTGLVTDRLIRLGVAVEVLEGGTGAVADVVGDPSGPVVALRADLDALPLQDLKEVPYRSQNPGVAHACGHDLHTSALVGAALALRRLAEQDKLPGTVRLLFQPAEEVVPGGALKLIEAGALRDVSRVFALHCDPRLQVGRLGIRTGPITAAMDSVLVRLAGPGGHTARPHLTSDLVAALAEVVSRTPAILSRRVDPLAAVSMVWGHIKAGAAGNAIPNLGEASATVRVFDVQAWARMRDLVPEVIGQVVAPYDAKVEIRYLVGLPPVINDADCTALARQAGEAVLGVGQIEETSRSMGGEDFAWLLEQVPGSLARLGVRPLEGAVVDLHRGEFDVDESAIPAGAMVLAATAVLALADR